MSEYNLTFSEKMIEAATLAAKIDLDEIVKSTKMLLQIAKNGFEQQKFAQSQ